jgi:hypothetical protein
LGRYVFLQVEVIRSHEHSTRRNQNRTTSLVLINYLFTVFVSFPFFVAVALPVPVPVVAPVPVPIVAPVPVPVVVLVPSFPPLIYETFW